jgi:hypothetical protein
LTTLTAGFAPVALYLACLTAAALAAFLPAALASTVFTALAALLAALVLLLHRLSSCCSFSICSIMAWEFSTILIRGAGMDSFFSCWAGRCSPLPQAVETPTNNTKASEK